MPCYHPLDAWQQSNGRISLGKELPDAEQLRLPCGGCIGCRKSQAQQWALRCKLELQDHKHAVFTTLTYSDENLPLTLSREELQRFLKRLRKRSNRAIRFFAAGEYGEQTHRPHYHAILYGISAADAQDIERTWARGYTTTADVTPNAIAYVAGYCSKKIGWRQEPTERTDPDTGEVYTWQPPFRQMSRRPGIGASARRWTDSWRLHAVSDGTPVPVPRYLHAAWKETATQEQIEQLQTDRATIRINKDTSRPRLEAAEKIAVAKHELRAAKRRL